MTAVRTVPSRRLPPRTRALAGRLLLLAGCAAGIQASELVIRDAFLELELPPRDFSFTLADGNGTRSGEDSFDSAYGLSINGLYSFAGAGDSHGWIVGGELALAQATYGSIGHLTSYVLRADGGYGWAYSDRWTIKGLAFVGYGRATLDITGNSAFSAFSASGAQLSYGAKLGTVFTLSERFLLNADVGYLIAKNDLSGGGVDMTIDNEGLLFGLGLTYRFSASPRPLD
jgi:hypothetical protein